MNLHDFQEHLIWAEGERLDLYKDSVGIYTIGVGHNIQEKGISHNVSRLMLKEDIQEVVDNCRTLTYWNDLDSVRQLVVADMVFNLGLTRFLKFTNLGVALLLGDFSKAGEEMIDSRWYVQVGRRAVRLVKAMRSGVWE